MHTHLRSTARGDATSHWFYRLGEALIGPATWDIAAHWFWSYTFDRPMMQACLAAYYPDGLLKIGTALPGDHLLYVFDAVDVAAYCRRTIGNG